MYRTRLLLALIVVLALSVFGSAAAFAAPPDPTLTVTLTAGKQAYTAAEPVVVNVTIANPSGHPVRVLKWYTPVDGVEESLFVVSVDGAVVPYTGPIYKRPEPKFDDYMMLKPGESTTSAVDLGAYYDLSVTGAYAVRYAVSSAELYGKGNGKGPKADTLISNDIELLIEGRAPSAPVAVTPEAVTGSTSFTKCTTTQQSQLLSARTEASNYASGALSYLNAKTNQPPTSRYATWFGAQDANRYRTVTTHFSAISSAMDTKAVTFDCGCKQKYYAYVYPTRPYVIYLCSVFWSVKLTGTDSKAGTLIHEMSHFNVVASTDDYVYGQSGAKSLAISNPAQAIDNADNHEYFAENTPVLP